MAADAIAGALDTLSVSSTYCYIPLMQRQIRLVKLHPVQLSKNDGLTAEDFEQPPRLELIQVDLDDAPDFTAISYTWGTPRRATLVLDNDSRIETSERVLEVLKRVRQAPDDGDLLVWIDQLCINQKDPAEKSHQIRMMRHIYATAARTYIVLADSSHEAEGSLFAVGQLAEAGYLEPRTSTGGNLRPHLSDGEGIRLIQSAWSADDLPETTRKMFSHQQWQADFAALLTDPVFRRAWIYQEVKSSRELHLATTVFSCHWDIFAAAVELFIAMTQLPQHAPELMPPHLRALNLMVEHRLKVLHGGFTDWMLLHVQAQGVLRSSDQRDLTLALTTFEGFYGQIPLYHDLTASQLYETAAWAMMSTSRSLDVWAAISGEWHSADKLGDNLPSWVPDWSTARRSVPFYWPRDRTLVNTPFDAAKGYPYIAGQRDKSGEFSILKVRGKQIDKITALVEPAFDDNSFDDTSVPDFLGVQQIGAAWVRHAQAAGKPLVEKIDFETVKPLRCALMAAMVNPRISDGSAMNYTSRLEGTVLDEVRWAYAYWPELEAGETLYHDGRPHWMSLFPRMYGSWKDFLPILKNWLRTCIGRRIVFGKTQGFGLVPAAAQGDDIVCILHGSRVPVVLRRLGRRYRLVGQCYWYEWMYGEKVDWKEDEGDLFEIV
jgi:hypothetical protein